MHLACLLYTSIHIVLIALPADRMNMGCVDNASAVWLVRKLDVDAFESLCLTACSAHHALSLIHI